MIITGVTQNRNNVSISKKAIDVSAEKDMSDRIPHRAFLCVLIHAYTGRVLNLDVALAILVTLEQTVQLSVTAMAILIAQPSTNSTFA